MVIKNLTHETQTLVVKEIIGEHREYDMYFQPHSSVELDRFLSVVHPERYAGIFDFKYGDTVVKKVDPVAEDPTKEKDVLVEKVKESEEIPVEDLNVEETPVEEVKEPEVAPDTFVCDICGSEFASARGLSNHKNKVHAE